MSFYDLVELVTFGRLVFDKSAVVRTVMLRTASGKKRMALSAAQPVALTPATDPSGLTADETTRIMYQSWGLLDNEHYIDWRSESTLERTIHIMSTIHGLSESLFVDEGLEVVIDRTPRVLFSPIAQQSARAAILPAFDEGALSVITWPPMNASERQHKEVQVLVDLKTLLTGVVVCPGASARFVRLVSELVRRITHAAVSQGSWPAEPITNRGVASPWR